VRDRAWNVVNNLSDPSRILIAGSNNMVSIENNMDDNVTSNGESMGI
jgi:hypothetical protein